VAYIGDYGTSDEMVAHVCEQLAEEFTGTFSPETIRPRRGVLRLPQQCPGSGIRTAIIPSVRQGASAGRRTGPRGHVKEVPEVLFVCVHNAGRSQMAAALLNRAAGGKVHVRSAGSTPANEIHAGVREAMAEIGVDLSQEFPKPLTDEVVRAADVVITMGCGDACPVYPGKKYLDWDLEDPANRPIEEVRPIRDEIDRRVRALLEELVPVAS
jgi:arsenate reductase (thioredoxin)